MQQLQHFIAHVRRMAIDTLFPPSDDQLQVRTLTPEYLYSLASLRTHENSEYDCVSILPYTDPQVRSCIREAKFNANEEAATLLGAVLHDALEEYISELRTFGSAPLCIIPIPLSAERFQERGFNQVERILRCAFPSSADTYIGTDILIRVRNTPPQTSQNGTERRKNLENAFVSPTCTADCTYILIDDVVTTGSTFAAAALALRQAGATRVVAMALAH